MRKIYILLSTVAGITLLMLLSSFFKQYIGLAANSPVGSPIKNHEFQPAPNVTQTSKRAVLSP